MDDGHCYVFSTNGPAVWDHTKRKTVRHWEDLAMPARYAVGTELDDYAGSDVYTAVSHFTCHPDGRTEGGEVRNGDLAVSVPGVWSDLDVKADVPHLPCTREELDAVVAALPTATMLVDSGSGGAHGYWLFAERQPVTEEIKSLVTAWIFHMNLTASQVLGRTIRFDAVGDLARVLRVPGSINQKNRSAVVLRYADGPRYTPEELRALIDPAAVQAAKDQREYAKTGSRITATARTEMTPRQLKYAEAARDGELADLAAVGREPDGRGNNRIVSVAKRLAGFLYCGAWTVEEIYERITDVVNGWPDPDPTMEKTITSALRVYADATFPADDDPDTFEAQVIKRLDFLRADLEAHRRLAQDNAIPVESISDALDAVLSGDRSDVPTVGNVTDDDQGRGLFYAGLVNGIFGDASAGKSLAMTDLQARILNDGGIVIHWEFDNNSQRILARRLINAGARPDAIRSGFLALRSLADRDRLAPDVVTNARLVTLDALSPAISALGMRSNDDQGVDAAFAAYFGHFTMHGACGLYIDHVGHDNKDRQRGSKRKFDATQGALYEMDCRTPLQRGGRGLSLLYLHKDNLAGAGTVGSLAAHVEYQSHGAGLVRTVVRRALPGEVPDMALLRGPGVDPEVKRAVLDRMRGNPGKHSRTLLVEALGRRAEDVREAVAELLAEGLIREDGPKNRPNLVIAEDGKAAS
ncbi:hypothetical protein [Streptomyces prunicolor]|uniref:hypothetical protein n=1 Tax=Streptomyces prunicolor TaxID=67348 RepID=UPI0033CC4DFE